MKSESSIGLDLCSRSSLFNLLDLFDSVSVIVSTVLLNV